jgi:hypothetical protein
MTSSPSPTEQIKKKYHFFLHARKVDGYSNLIEFNGDTTVEMIKQLLDTLNTHD